MPSVNVSESTKTRFDSLKDDDLSQDEFMESLLSIYRATQNGGLDEQTIIDAINHETAAKAELAAYRACADYHESHE